MIVLGCVCGIVAMYLIVQLIYFKEIGKMRKAKAMAKKTFKDNPALQFISGAEEAEERESFPQRGHPPKLQRATSLTRSILKPKRNAYSLFYSRAC